LHPSQVTVDQLHRWMEADSEDEHLEFKEAKWTINFGDLCKYCIALANERGGVLILGVTNKRPRKVVGSQAIPSLVKTKQQLFEQLRVRIEIDVVTHPTGRVVVLQIPSRPLGVPLAHDGFHWMRVGESVVPMTHDVFQRIFDERVPDFSAEVCAEATLESLSAQAMERFQAGWVRKSGRQRLADLSPQQILADAELLLDGAVTYAALVLLGTRAALSRHLGDAEVIFEYRSSSASIEYQSRSEYREGFLLFHDDLWQAIDTRNELQHYQEGLFKWGIPTLNEKPAREAILNAVTHRDYRMPGSVFVCQYPRRLCVTSPGGFVAGVTEENILTQSAWRNRRLAESLAKCGFVERSGQGIDLMFESCLREGKPRPDFTGTDSHRVSVTLHGTADPMFVRFLETVSSETQVSFTLEDMLVLDLLHRESPIPEDLRGSLHRLLEAGAIERKGKGRGVRYHLSRRYYRAIGRPGVYTRKAGLDRETHRQLLLKHIRENASEGSRLSELTQVLPELSCTQVQRLLREMKARGSIHCVGRTNAGRWYPGPVPATRA